MRLTPILLSFALACLATPANAQMDYATEGGNALTQSIISTVDLPDGNMLVRNESSGFTWADDETAVGGNGTLDCFVSVIVTPDGEQLDGSGICEGMDEDGDLWWVWVTGGTEGEFGFTGGTGKYAGISGGGTWKQQVRYADGKAVNDWEGSWTIPAHGME